MKLPLLVLCGLLLTSSLGGQSSQSLWPGFGPRVARLAQHLVSTARVLILRIPGEPDKTLWVKRTRRYRKENGWFGLEVNGQPLEEKYTYLEYGGRLENLQALFTLGSSFADELETFRLENLDKPDKDPEF